MEVRERKDRVTKALNATRAVVEEWLFILLTKKQHSIFWHGSCIFNYVHETIDVRICLPKQMEVS